MALRRAGTGLRRAGSGGGLRLLSRGRELGVASLVSALPSFMSYTQGAGSWSYQSAPILNGTTFILYGTTQNFPRFDYDALAARTMLLMEPARTNEGHYSNFVDAAADDNVPDNWTGTGTVDVDFQSQSGGPHGGQVLAILDTNTNSRGCHANAGVAALTLYQCSIWMRGVAGAADLFYALHLGGAAFAQYTAPAGTYDWTRVYTSGTTEAVPGSSYYMRAVADPAGVVRMCMAQVEAGDCPTSWIPTPAGAVVTRAAALCAIDPAVVGRLSGDVSFLWRPDYPSTQALGLDPVLHAWAPGYELLFDPADDKLKVMVAGTKRAESAALSFARKTPIRVRVRYGAAGQQLTVDGVSTVNSTAWGDPGILAPYLGSRAASANCKPAAYGDYISAAA